MFSDQFLHYNHNNVSFTYLIVAIHNDFLANRHSMRYVDTHLKHNQQTATFSRSIYFCKLLYMFQAVTPPTIRSTKLYIQRLVLSNHYCCLLLSWMRYGTAFHLNKVQRFLDLFISVNCSTCFRRLLRPPSVAQNCTYSVWY
jgi:hypothetical protein